MNYYVFAYRMYQLALRGWHARYLTLEDVMFWGGRLDWACERLSPDDGIEYVKLLG